MRRKNVELRTTNQDRERLAQIHAVAPLDLERAVRDALASLAGERLVTIRPNRGARVVRLSTAEIEEVFELRIMLEEIIPRLRNPRFAEPPKFVRSFFVNAMKEMRISFETEISPQIDQQACFRQGMRFQPGF